MKIEVPLAAAFLLLVGCSSDDAPANPTTTTSSTSSTSAGSGGAGGAASTSTSATSATGGTAGSTGSGTGGSGGGSARPAEIPASDSVMDIGTFVQNGDYKKAPWISDVAAPRMGGTGTQHGDNIRVWLNPTVVTALRAGHDGQIMVDGGTNPPPDQYSMAVKEMYDDAKTNVVGVAVSLRSGSTTGFDAWTYYCYAPGTQCLASRSGTKEMPIYGKGNMASAQPCAICHGNTVYTTPP